MADKLPEGTDHILPGSEGARAAKTDAPSKPAAVPTKADVAELKEQAKSKAEDFKEHALDQIRDYAQEGQARASGALDGVAKLIGDNAEQIDQFAGTHYGDYARRASAYVSGAAADVRDKDIDELLDVARDFVRRAPGAALAVAATAGFFAARLVKAGTAEGVGTPGAIPPATRKTPARGTDAGSNR